MISLDSILNELKGAPAGEKVASEKTEAPSKVAQAKTDLLDALKRAETATTQKTAAEAPVAAKPAEELQKIASDLAAADQEALTKEAHLYGAAICDGFMSRLKQYEGAAVDGSAKTASAVDVEKIASEAIRGYVETQNRIKIAAEQEYQRGYNDTMAEVEKIASDVFAVGARDCAEVLMSLAK